MLKKLVAAVLVLSLVASITPIGFADEFQPATPEDKMSNVTDTPPVAPTPEPSPDATPAPVPPPVEGGTTPSYTPPSTAHIRVGLFHGGSALASANLANEVGSGYDFGWYDAKGGYTRVGYTAENKITVLKDKTIYVANGVYYDGLPPAGASTIGAYHVQSGEVYNTFEQARTAADTLLQNGTAAFVAFVGSEYRLRAGVFTTEADAMAAVSSIGFAGGTAVGASATCYTVVATASGKILFELDSDRPLGIRPVGAAKTETWFKQYRYNGGLEYRRNGGDLTVINVVTLGDYTRGVIPYEVGLQWHAEALKVAALCASSYAMHNSGRHKSSGFDVCNTIDCQMYQGQNRATDYTNAACDAVAGLAVFYDGKVCNTVYHSSNGGSTEAAKNVWGTDFPYLQAVADDMEPLDDLAHGRWSTTYTGAEIAWILTQKDYPIGTVTKVYIDEFTAAGNVYRLTFEDASGGKRSFTMERCRIILASDTYKKYVFSQRYNVSSGSGVALVTGSDKVRQNTNDAVYAIGSDGVSMLPVGADVYIMTAGGTDVVKPGVGDGSFTFSGTGYGHNVGLSQYGSKVRAESGWTYEQIIKFYFTGVEILPVSY